MYKMQKLNVVRIVATEEQKSMLISQGYKEIAEVKPDYSNMLLDDLKKMAKEKNVQGYSTMKKDELVTILAALDGVKESDSK